MDREEFFCLKAAALLHTPPIKAWAVIGKFDAKNFDFIGEAVSALSRTRLNNVKDYLEDGKVKYSEGLAEGVDQWLLNKLVGEDYRVLGVSEVKIKNVFNPSFSQEISRVPEPHILKDYISSIKSMLGNVVDVGLAYHLLYACYEPLWILKGLPVGPVDTRVPTNSVFDHSYATASMMNWLLSSAGKVDGILLFIDLAGVQKVISSSRKLRDLWISSYLVSALAWRLFWIFVKPLGPDVLLLPTCRDNQFYYHSLMSELSGKVDDKTLNLVKEIALKLTNYDLDNDVYPNFAVIPATGSLVLPSIKVLKEFEEFKDINSLSDLENFVKRQYEKIWSELFNTVSKYCGEIQKSDSINVLGYFHDLLEACRKYGFDKVPPMPIRVIALSTEKLYDLAARQGVKLEDYEVYNYMFRFLQYEQWQKKLLRSRPEENLLLFDMTSQPQKTWPEETDRGFDYCTVCGYLPAIVIMPTERKLNGESKYEKTLKEMKIKVEDVRPIFGPGERLCPYCLIKRIISLDDIRKKVFSQLIGKASERMWKIIFPSVTDIAIAKFRETLVDKADRIGENEKLVESMVKKIDKLLGGLRSQEGRPLLKAEENLLSRIKNIKNDELRQDLEGILKIDSEQTILRDRNSIRNWTRFIRSVNEETKQYKPDVAPLQAYYSLLTCDGDNMGKIITGCIKDGFGVTVKEYLSNAAEGDFKILIEHLFKNEKEEAVNFLNSKGIQNSKEKVEELAALIGKLNSREEIFVSPLYHASFSRALMRSAVNDSKMVEELFGLAVYAGGDELLAVMPADKSLEAVQKIREKFNLPSPILGFYTLNSYFFVPSLVSAGRSFSVYFAHYMFPLYSVVRNNSRLLDDFAKKTKWPIPEMEKDTLALTYSPRGGGITALLPLGPSLKSQKRELAKPVKEIKTIFEKIDNEVFSISLLYDLENNSEMIKKLIKSDTPLIMEKVLEHIFERNSTKKDKKAEKEGTKEKEWTPHVKSLKEKYKWAYILESGDHEERYFLNDFIKSLIIYKSGVRGVAL